MAMGNKSQIEQLKSQLQIDRNIAEDDTINAMPDSGNVDAFARALVSAALSVNQSLKARDGRFGSEAANGIVSIMFDDEDEFGGNDNNRRVALRIKREQAQLGKAEHTTAALKAKAQAEPDDDVVGKQRDLDRDSNENNSNVDLSQVATVQPTGGVDTGNKDVPGGMPGMAFKPVNPKSGSGPTAGGFKPAK